MTLKQEYKLAVKNGYKNSYKQWLKEENAKLDKILKVLNKVK